MDRVQMQVWNPPSVGAIRAFEAAARLLSFTKAAAELHVTQSAVSHSVHELEQRLGVSLFVRDGRRLTLSTAGRLYLPYLSEALGLLRDGDRAIFNPARRERVLTVSVSPSFAAKWLVPRLGAFSAAHPDLDLRISANPEHIDFGDGEIDLAVRHGDGNWPDLDCTRLCEEEMYPVCSPLLMRSKSPRSPADLIESVLIHHSDTQAWRTWLKSFGIQRAARQMHGPIFSEISLAIDAAIAGQGIALARSALASRDIAEGRLIRPMKQTLPAQFAYWIVCPRSVAAAPKIVRFKEWLLGQAVERTKGRPRKPS